MDVDSWTFMTRARARARARARVRTRVRARAWASARVRTRIRARARVRTRVRARATARFNFGHPLRTRDVRQRPWTTLEKQQHDKSRTLTCQCTQLIFVTKGNVTEATDLTVP